MSRLLVRLLIGLAACCGLVLVLASSVVLHGAAVAVVVVPAVLVAAVAWGVQEEPRPAIAWTAAAATVFTVVVAAGIGVLAGAGVALLVTGLLAAVLTVVWLVRKWKTRAAPKGSPPHRGTEPALWAGWLDTSPAPVVLLSPAVLGMEWRRTTAALATRLTPEMWQAVIRRRAEVLDELERREPAGFERWLTTGAAHGADPTEFLRRGRAPGAEAA